MLFTCIKTELMKLKRNPLWIAFFAVPAFSTLLGTINYVINQGILSNTWASLWTQHTLFLCLFFMPCLIATFCATLWRVEYLHHNMNTCFTMPVKRSTICFAKFLTAGIICLLSLLWIFLLFIIAGKIAGIAEPFSFVYLGFIGCGFLGSMVIVSAQMLISTIIKKFGLNIAIAFGATIAAFAFFAKGWALYFPYSQFSYGMRANNPNMDFSLLPFIGLCLFYILIFNCISQMIIRKRDICSE